MPYNPMGENMRLAGNVRNRRMREAFLTDDDPATDLFATGMAPNDVPLRAQPLFGRSSRPTPGGPMADIPWDAFFEAFNDKANVADQAGMQLKADLIGRPGAGTGIGRFKVQEAALEPGATGTRVSPRGFAYDVDSELRRPMGRGLASLQRRG